MGQYELAIIDLLEQPQRAIEDRIIATPTLVREHPSPSRRMIGDLSNTETILWALDLQPFLDPEEPAGKAGP